MASVTGWYHPYVGQGVGVAKLNVDFTCGGNMISQNLGTSEQSKLLIHTGYFNAYISSYNVTCIAAKCWFASCTKSRTAIYFSLHYQKSCWVWHANAQFCSFLYGIANINCEHCIASCRKNWVSLFGRVKSKSLKTACRTPFNNTFTSYSRTKNKISTCNYPLRSSNLGYYMFPLSSLVFLFILK